MAKVPLNSTYSSQALLFAPKALLVLCLKNIDWIDHLYFSIPLYEFYLQAECHGVVVHDCHTAFVAIENKHNQGWSSQPI